MSNVVFKDYPYWAAETIEHIRDQLGQITHTRKDDILQIQNLSQIFLAGRSVGKIPTDSDDVVAKDKIGDLSYEYNAGMPYMFILMDDGADGKWIRFSGSVF